MYYINAKILIGKTVCREEGIYGNFLQYLLNFSVNLKLLKKSLLVKKRKQRKK